MLNAQSDLLDEAVRLADQVSRDARSTPKTNGADPADLADLATAVLNLAAIVEALLPREDRLPGPAADVAERIRLNHARAQAPTEVPRPEAGP